jgi:hypothetical protein
MKRLSLATVLAALAGLLAAAAFAAQPTGSASYGGTFKGGKGYVSIHAEKNQDIEVEVIDTASVQYACKGKAATVGTPKSFKPVPISSDGRFVIKYRGDILNEQFKKTGKKGRVRIVGRFKSAKLARGRARVRNKTCAQKERAYTVRGPQIEG